MSIWEDVVLPAYPTLNKNLEVDTIIIGGGMTGVQTLFCLRGKNALLVEARKIGSGVTKNTSGKINYLQENALFSFYKKGKVKLAQAYLQAELESISLMKSWIHQYHIDCDFKEVSSYLVSKKVQNQRYFSSFSSFLKQNGIDVLTRIPKSIPYPYGIGVKNTYVFHPFKYLKGLLEHMKRERIYENTEIVKIVTGQNYYYCHTNLGYCIRAKNVVVACHYPFFFFPSFFPVQTSLVKSYEIVFEVPKNLKYTYILVEKPNTSVRFVDFQKKHYQICVGETHDITKSGNDLWHFQNLERLFSVADSSVYLKYSNVDIVTADHLPIIKEVKPHFYLATGYQTWGMSGSVLGARLVSSMIFQTPTLRFKDSSFHPFFYPVHIFSSAKAFLFSKHYQKDWYPSSLTFSFLQGKAMALYRCHGKLHLVYPVCPHMGCSLLFNIVEQTWDCPCHSSRFDMDGNLLKGPALHGICVNFFCDKNVAKKSKPE